MPTGSDLYTHTRTHTHDTPGTPATAASVAASDGPGTLRPEPLLPLPLLLSLPPSPPSGEGAPRRGTLAERVGHPQRREAGQRDETQVRGLSVEETRAKGSSQLRAAEV